MTALMHLNLFELIDRGEYCLLDYLEAMAGAAAGAMQQCPSKYSNSRVELSVNGDRPRIQEYHMT